MQFEITNLVERAYIYFAILHTLEWKNAFILANIIKLLKTCLFNLLLFLSRTRLFRLLYQKIVAGFEVLSYISHLM